MTLHLGSKYKLKVTYEGVAEGACIELTWIGSNDVQFRAADGVTVTVPLDQVKNLFTECRCCKCS